MSKLTIEQLQKARGDFDKLFDANDSDGTGSLD